jgi:hypothetical protein
VAEYGSNLKLLADAEGAELTRDARPAGCEGVTTLTGIRSSV